MTDILNKDCAHIWVKREVIDTRLLGVSRDSRPTKVIETCELCGVKKK